MTTAARRMAAVALPKHRRWRRLLRSLTFDPADVDTALEEPSSRDFIICGSPRTGTALLAAMLFQPPRSVVVMEPWDAFRMPPAELFSGLRQELQTGGVLRRGRLDIAALQDHGEVSWCRDGELPTRVELGPDVLLGVKFPALWRYLDRLSTTRFLVCLRDPLAVIPSYRATGGQLAQGQDYAIRFNRAMNDYLRAATDDHAVRRVMLYDYINERILPHLDRPNVMAVRYERWTTEPDSLLAELSTFLEADLSKPLAALRPPRHGGSPPQEELAVIRGHCRTASALGYDLDPDRA